jgi:membrane-associated phospholipid phosphatase
MLPRDPASAYVSSPRRDSIAGMDEHPDPSIRSDRSDWKRLILPIALAILAVGALWLDLPIARYFAKEPWRGDLNTTVRLCEAFGYGLTAAFILLAAAALDPRGWRVLPRLAISTYGAGLAADAMKLFVGRHRPKDIEHVAATALDTFTTWANHQHTHLTQSFPSAHTATATGLACGLAFFYPRGWWLFAILAALCGLQRMHSLNHYLSDVLAGAAIGALVGILATSRLPTNRWLDRLEIAAAKKRAIRE